MRALLLLGAMALLAGCNREPEVDVRNASPSEVAKELRKADAGEGFVQPGKWQQTVTMVEMTAPGMPPQMAEAMKKSAGTSQVHETCLTPQQAKHPREDFFTGADQNCKYEHFQWGHGKIDLKMLCTHPQATQTMALIGTYEPESYALAMTATTRGSTPAEEMTMRMKVDAKRVGECAGKEG